MKKILSSLLLLGLVLPAHAVYMLPEPEDLTHQATDTEINITWHNKSTTDKITNYHVIVYKAHKATAAEKFVLADNDFSYIESVGTINKHEHRGGGWANVAGSPGWYAKSPKYMNGAIGIDTYFYYAGSDNDDYFGGAYLLSPHYDLSGLKEPVMHVSASLAAEAVSVSGGFCIYVWSKDFWTEGREHYIPMTGDWGHDYHYSDLSTTYFKTYEEDCDVVQQEPTIYNDRVRVCFYGTGYSMYWVDDLKITVDMQPGDEIRYAAEFYDLPANKDEINNFVINIADDNENDYVYGYQIRGVYMEPYFDIDTYDTNNYIRFISPDNLPTIVGTKYSGLETVAASETDIRFAEGTIYVAGEENVAVEIYNVQGAKILSGLTNTPIKLDSKGIYIVKAGDATKKIIF